MKLCITATQPSLDAEMDSRFGRCRYFAIIDSETGEHEFIENKNINGVGGVGIQSAQLLSQKGVQAVATGQVGPNAFQTLASAGIRVYSGLSGSVCRAFQEFKDEKLTPTENPDAQPKSGI